METDKSPTTNNMVGKNINLQSNKIYVSTRSYMRTKVLIEKQLTYKNKSTS
jgi:hypothetical protein